MRRRHKTPTALPWLPPLLAVVVLAALAGSWATDGAAREPRPLRTTDQRVRVLAPWAAVRPAFPPPSFHAPAVPGARADLFAVTTALPDPTRPGAVVDVIAWDPARMTTAWIPGTMEPKTTEDMRSGVLPKERAHFVRAAFNGGFRTVHGAYGSYAFGAPWMKLRDGAATIVELADGENVLGTWPLRIDTNEIRSLRQNLPPLVENGQLNPTRRAPTQWGAVTPDSSDPVHAVRSGVCQRTDGLMLYLWGAELSADALGTAMLGAQCTYGIHLDMNPGLTGFEFCEPPKDPAAQGGGTGKRFHSRMSLATFPLCGGRSPRDFFVLAEREALAPSP